MFRTEISISPSSLSIDHSTRLVTIGSCFSEAMGEKLSEHKFQVHSNPFGTIFNPISIFRLLETAIDCKEPDEQGYIQSSEIHQHLDFHSQFGSMSRPELTEKLNSVIVSTHNSLKSAEVLIITFGTSVVYEYLRSTNVVANCHKLSQREFRRFVLNVDQITKAFDALIGKMNSFNSQLKIILTVSPVRHVKDGLPINGLSKALLRTASDEMEREYDNVSYFPSFEIMMDDLRDYRFYEADMIHPSETAEQYIWKRFTETYMSQNTMSILQEWKKILKAIHHKPFNPQSNAHQKFISETINKLQGFSNKFEVSEELEALKRQLI